MQYFRNSTTSAACTVTVTTRDVAEFAASWPCSGLRARPVTFEFDARGNLVDSNDQRQHPRADGSAMLALCDDAKAYAASRRAFGG